ncbi:MAG: molybdate ABC transporter substrate-binding protein [Terriglobia bacterium]
MRRRTGKWAEFLAALFLTVLTSLSSPHGAEAAGSQILVSAAVSLKEAFNQIANLYTQRTGVSVTFSLGASGELEKQIEAGAPVDVFASAGEKEMRELGAKGLIDASTQADFARNSLVLVMPVDSKLRLRSFSNLRQPQVKMIAIGNPRTVPAGRYAKQLLESNHLWTTIQSRLVFAENVRQVLDYVDHGEVDAGIVYATDVEIAHGKVTVAARAPNRGYGPILYPIAVVKGSSHAQAARGFVNLVLSSDGMNILRKYGFLAAK